MKCIYNRFYTCPHYRNVPEMENDDESMCDYCFEEVNEDEEADKYND